MKEVNSAIEQSKICRIFNFERCIWGAFARQAILLFRMWGVILRIRIIFIDLNDFKNGQAFFNASFLWKTNFYKFWKKIVTWKLFRHQKNKQLSEYEVETSKFNQGSFWNEISQFWFSVQTDNDNGGGGGAAAAAAAAAVASSLSCKQWWQWAWLTSRCTAETS